VYIRHAVIDPGVKTPPSNEKLAYLGTLSSGLVHELRNPLNAIRANLQLMEEDMLREEKTEGPHTRRVRRLLGEVGRLDKILSDFLAFVRGDELRTRRQDLSALLQEVVTLITPQADGQGTVLLSDLAENLEADIDPEAIRQAILNLALNGLQAMPPNVDGKSSGGTLMIRLARGMMGDGPAAVIDVIDTGRGIPPEAEARIFELFYTTREGGTGIGLAVVAKIIAAHGGEIRCESELGKGTSFKIRLPLERKVP
jgi:two-component system, NtrC family, sensor histidine kinase HydH